MYVHICIYIISIIKPLKRHSRDPVLVLINSQFWKEDLINFAVLVFKEQASLTPSPCWMMFFCCHVSPLMNLGVLKPE